jgi:serine/threonine protein phosphatase 1
LAWLPLASAQRSPKPCIPKNRRIYAVGDIHGRADLLAALFGRIDDDLTASPIAQPLQVFLGDYIDRGPDSRLVVDMLIERRRPRTTLFLKGNHEDYAAAVLNDKPVVARWLKLGGVATLLSYGVKTCHHADPMSEQNIAAAFRRAIPDRHRRFIEGLALSFTCGDFFFAHAGVRPGIPLGVQSQRDLLWIRDDFLLHEEDFGKIVVHGHSPEMAPDIRRNRINIDTGAYATGRLTCLVLEGEQMRFL